MGFLECIQSGGPVLMEGALGERLKREYHLAFHPDVAMATLPEAAGMARAMEATGLPYMISFTIQRDGCLVDGTPIADAIAYIDAVTTRNPACYMTNCVHPTIVRAALEQPCNRTEAVSRRFRGIQANTSPLSYGELELATELLCAEPEELAKDMMALREISDLHIFGGCCGTDDRHLAAVARRLTQK